MEKIPQQPTPEEQVELEKSRTISDAELLKDGAEYKMDEETGEKRLEVTNGQYDEIHNVMDREFYEQKRQYIEKIKTEVHEKLDDLPMEDVIKLNPQLAEKVEAIPLGDFGISLFRTKEAPELAMSVWSKSKERRGTQGGVTIMIPEERLPEGIMDMRFQATCVCCSPEREYPNLSLRTHYPSSPELSDNLSHREQMRQDDVYEEKVKEWQKTEEGQKYADWLEQRKNEYKKAMQKICTENNIKYLAVRNASIWNEKYGALDGVEMIEMAGAKDVASKLNELRESHGFQKLEKTEIRKWGIARGAVDGL